MSIKLWIAWAALLIAQNFSFTFVSRARNSGSLKRHMVAALFSNGIWFVSQLLVVSAFLGILSGKYGWRLSVFAGIFYTLLTLSGSLLAHHFALKTEKGKGAVGANKKYAQITTEEWEQLKKEWSQLQSLPNYRMIPLFSEPKAAQEMDPMRPVLEMSVSEEEAKWTKITHDARTEIIQSPPLHRRPPEPSNQSFPGTELFLGEDAENAAKGPEEEDTLLGEICGNIITREAAAMLKAREAEVLTDKEKESERAG